MKSRQFFQASLSMCVSLSNMLPIRKITAGILLLVLTMGFNACGKASEGKRSWSFEKKHSYEKVSLRGYGELSGDYWTSISGSVLEIRCADEEKAKLVQAKYLSDMVLLPETSKTVFGKITVIEAKDQGILASLRFGRDVVILSSENKVDFEKLLTEVTGQLGKKFTSSAEVEVPMYLDRWEKYSFRFYYRPWEKPKGKDLTTYDVFDEFDFAEKSEKSGFLFWWGEEPLDTAEGITADVYWNWALQAAAKKNLPVAVNTGIGTAGSGWFFNRYREQASQKAPQFCGSFHSIAEPYMGANGFTSWNATTARDAEMGLLQSVVEKTTAYPNVISFMEANQELRHGAYDLFLEYGPVADGTYRTFLKEKYGTIEKLSQSWGRKVAAWNEVCVPEVAEFLGWGKEAMDLSGEWKIGYEKILSEKNFTSNELKNFREPLPTEKAPDDWYSEKFDDSAWPTVVAPGHDRTMFLLHRPAVYRRTVDIPAAWLEQNRRVWLYVWDLNSVAKNFVKVAVNGKTLVESEVQHAKPHWMVVEVTGAIRGGKNQVSLRIPEGYLGYRVYLSPEEPRQYPNLSEGKNAQWCDFSDWIGWSRVEALRRGMEMIRQVEPNKGITLAAPNAYVDGVKKLASSYGGEFHNTGYMGAWWADDLPSYMRGAKLPFSIEPGSPAKDWMEFKKMMGLYATECIQAIDYFIHIGDVMWDTEIRKEFEETLPMIRLIGKYRGPTAEVAGLYSTRGAELTGYPWGQDPNTNLGSAYWVWNIRANLIGRYESDALTESSFANGDAARYKVIIDTNTSIMEDETLAQIEKYVRDGGTFITFVQTGRHTPTQKDTWHISKLTGYDVVKIDPLNANGNPLEWRTMVPAPGQEVFAGDWSKQRANGLSLKKVAPDAKDLMLWKDGSTAIGMRQLGKGYIVQVGCKYHGDRMPQRYESKMTPEGKTLGELFSSILRWRGIAPIEVRMEQENDNAFIRHYVTTNGLYDVWTVWNRNDKETVEGKLILPDSVKSSWAWDVQAKVAAPLAEHKIPLRLEPYKYIVYLTPRHEITSTSLEWFDTQRNWWRGTTPPTSKKFEKPSHKFSVDLCEDWAFKPLQEGEDAIPYTVPEVKDGGWEKMRIGIWSAKHRDVKHAILRRTFTVPKEWQGGKPTLWVKGWNHRDFADRGRVWLDGKLISDWSSNKGPSDANPDGVLIPGSTHTLAIEIDGKGCLVGSQANVYLWYWPKPSQVISLDGTWNASDDALRYERTVQLPGEAQAFTFRRNVEIPANLSGKNIVIDIEGKGPLAGVMINGRWIRRLHHLIEEHFQLNITPYVRFGQVNEIEIVNRAQDGNFVSHRVDVRNVALHVHEADVYP